MTYVRSLDGMRALAVALVMLYHFGVLECGWLGVQLFFVLSGFLITQILVSQRENRFGAYLGRFYKRRALRIFPLFYLYAGTFALSYALTGHPAFSRAQLALLFGYAFNVAQVLNGVGDQHWVSHLWSLAVEEQFYLIWPLIVFILSPRALRVFAMGLLIACPLARLFVSIHFFDWAGGLIHPDLGTFVYRLTPFQLDAFAAGALVGLGPTRAHPRRRFAIALVAVAVLGALNLLAMRHLNVPAEDSGLTTFGYPQDMVFGKQFVWGFSLINFLGAELVRTCITPGAAFKLLEHPALVAMGRISYGLYVYHLAIRELILTFLRHAPSTLELVGLFIIYIVASFALAAVSWRFFESRILALKDRPWRSAPALSPSVDA
ncbi:MAG: acyltransferase [Deltaproteobacteria bacterium]|nr:acyltransferase [Deltaproteobacteria bacterium]